MNEIKIEKLFKNETTTEVKCSEENMNEETKIIDEIMIREN